MALVADSNTDIDPPGLRRAHALQFAGLKYPQQLGLLPQRDIGDFIQKKCAAVGQFEAANAIGACIGKRPFYVAEDLALERALRQAARIHRHQRHARTRRSGVQQLGHDLLARAVLSGDQNVGVRRPHLRNQLQHRLHRRRPGHELRQALGPQQAVLHLQLPRPPQRLVQLGMDADQADQPLILPRLLDKVASSPLDAFYRQPDVAPGRHDDDRQARIDLLDARQQVQALLPRRCVAGVVQIDQEDVVLALPQGFQHQLRRAHALHLHALWLQQKLYGLQDVGLIVGDQDSDFIFLTRDGSPPLRRGSQLVCLLHHPCPPPRRDGNHRHRLSPAMRGCFL